MNYWRYGVGYDYWKFVWGLFFFILYAVGIIALIRNVWKT
jgi:hypothetical protein